jgi:hypothetical protein
MSESRDSYSGPIAALAAVLADFEGPSICRYGDESEKTAKAKLILKGSKGIFGNLKLLEALQKLQGNLSFAKVPMKSALKEVYEKKLAQERAAGTGGWATRMTPKEVEDWVETLQRRIRNMCRVTSQAIIKQNAVWLAELPWYKGGGANEELDGEESDEEEAKDKDSEVEAEDINSSKGSEDEKGDTDRPSAVKKKPAVHDRRVHFSPATTTTYGFSKELMLPWREVPGQRRECGLPCTVPKKANVTDKVIANWPDGTSAKLDITYGDLQALDIERKHGGPQAGNLAELEVQATKHKLAILQKVDRNLLVILTEQNKQLCMVKVSVFGAVADEKRRLPNDDPVVQKAKQFMLELAKQYAAGTVRKSELNVKRNEALWKMGLNYRKRKAVVAKVADTTAEGSTPRAKPKAKCTAAKMAAAAAAARAVGGAPSSQQGHQGAGMPPPHRPSSPPSSTAAAASTPAPANTVCEPPSMDTYDVVMKFFNE